MKSNSKSNSGSLYSKLKVLVAKLYKAEKLYSSMRTIPQTVRSAGPQAVRSAGFQSRAFVDNDSPLPQTALNRAPNLKLKTDGKQVLYAQGSDSSGILIEHANEIRASEWYQVHHLFREKLNSILEKGNTPNVPLELNRIWHEFSADFEMAEVSIRDATEMAQSALDRQEYAHLLKISSELIRRKARLQALKVIHDELNVLISPIKRSSNGIDIKDEALNRQVNYAGTGPNEFAGNFSDDPNHSVLRQLGEGAVSSDNSELMSNTPSNVIPLRRKAS